MNGCLWFVIAMCAIVLVSPSAHAEDCGSDNDCKGERICVKGACEFPPPIVASPCQIDKDCSGDLVCENSQCIAPRSAGVVPAPVPAPVPAVGQGGYQQVAPAAAQPGYQQPAVAYPPPAQQPKESPFALWRTGLDLEARLGMIFCISADHWECTEGSYGLRPGPGGGVYVGARFLPFLGVGIDFGYYMFNANLDDDADKMWARMMNVMLQVRGYLPFRVADVYLKVSGGYLSYKEAAEWEGESYSERLSAPFNVKVGAGFTFFFKKESKNGDIGVGADLDYLITAPNKWAGCEGSECYDGDVDESGSEIIDSLQLSVHFYWAIPLF